MNEEERKLFEDLAIKELDACGYFLSGQGIGKSMDQIIMDFSCLYCMEYYYKNYKYEEEIQKS